MSQITLTLDFTPSNILVLSEMLPRLEANNSGSTESVTTLVSASTKSDTPVESKSTPATSDKKADKPRSAPATKEKATADTPAAPSKTDVRAVALKLSKAGQQDKLKEIFSKYGADKLSDIAESDYPTLMKDLEEAANE